MKILYDAQIFFAQKHGGISRYFYELLCSSEAAVETQVAVLYHRNQYLAKISESLPLPQKNPLAGRRSFPGRGILHKILEKISPSVKPKEENEKYLLRQIAQTKTDIFHPTYYSNYFLNNIGDVPFVLTIYDMIHELYPEYFVGDRTAVLKSTLFEKAERIIAISETTKKDILEFYNCAEERVKVVQLACSLNPDKAVLPGEKVLPAKYILYVGDRRAYKNFLFFVTAILSLLKEDDELCLICTGPSFNEKEKEFLRLHKIFDKVLQISASDEELVYLYRHARVFVFPSLYEGFGLPVLEAFACGCPAVLSNKGSLPEIAGDASLYFDPKSVSDIRDTVNKVLSSISLREDLIQKGKQRLRDYSWAKTVKETQMVYRDILS